MLSRDLAGWDSLVDLKPTLFLMGGNPLFTVVALGTKGGKGVYGSP